MQIKKPQHLFQRTPLLNGRHPEHKREEIRSYFHVTLDRYEQLYETLANEEAYFRKPIALRSPVEAPDGTIALPTTPEAKTTSASKVGLPRESKTSLARISIIAAIFFPIVWFLSGVVLLQPCRWLLKLLIILAYGATAKSSGHHFLLPQDLGAFP